MALDLNDPSLDFAGQSDIIARALRTAQQQRDLQPSGPQFHGKWNVTGGAIPTVLSNMLGEYGVNNAEAQQTALNKEQISRFDNIAKQLGTPGTKRGQVLQKTLSGDQQGPEQTLEGDVPLSPIEENQRQMGLGMQMSKLPMSRGVGLEFVKSGANFPEKMAQLQSQQQQAQLLALQRAHERSQDLAARLEDKSLDRASREALAREGMELRKSIAELIRRAAGANQRDRFQIMPNEKGEMVRVNVDTLEQSPLGITKPAPKESDSASKGRVAGEMLMSKVDSALKELEANPNAVGWKTLVPSVLLQRASPEGVTARLKVGELGAEKAHELYGAAFSQSEQKRADAFIPAAGDDYPTVVKKLQGMKALAEEANKRHSKGSSPRASTHLGTFNPATGEFE